MAFSIKYASLNRSLLSLFNFQMFTLFLMRYCFLILNMIDQIVSLSVTSMVRKYLRVKVLVPLSFPMSKDQRVSYSLFKTNFGTMHYLGILPTVNNAEEITISSFLA
uniref:Ovule protein n=1 Tax=Heterorhabditis bacteriophora TaxID=37862 RepID=A0A1I7WFB9_HETBA